MIGRIRRIGPVGAGCVALTILAIALVAGCGGQQRQEDAAKRSEVQTADDDKLQIGVVPKGLAHQFWLTVKAGAGAAAKEIDAQVIWQGPPKETEIDKQISIIEDMITRGVGAIVMAACDQNALTDAVKRADKAGITVVTIDSGVKSDIPISFVATDNIAGAEAAADTLAELIGKKGEVALIPFVPGAATSELREKGFKEGIKKYPDIELVAVQPCQGDPAKAMSITQDIITSNPDLKGIFAANEPAAIGCGQALKAAGKTGEITLVAFDASEKQITDLKDGVCQALMVQNPFKMGYEGVMAAYKHINGEEVPNRIDTGVTVVTMDNFKDPEIQKLLFPLD